MGKNQNTTLWTDELHARMLALRAEGCTVLETARRLDMTLGQVMGRLNRTGNCRAQFLDTAQRLDALNDAWAIRQAEAKHNRPLWYFLPRPGKLTEA